MKNVLSDKKRIMLIMNPNAGAGKGKSKTRLFNVLSVFEKKGYDVTVFNTKDKLDATKIVKTKAENFDLIVCLGGDGTLNEVINGIMSLQNPLPLGYIPTGTTNDMSISLGLSRNVKKAANDIINGTVYTHDIGLFNNERYFSYIASFGAFTEVSYMTPQQSKNAIGHLAYVLEAFRSLGNIRPHQIKLQFDDNVIEDEFVFGAVTNSKSVGGIFKLQHNEIVLNDGVFEILFIRNPKNAIEWTNVFHNLIYQKYDNKYIVYEHAKNITIKTEDTLSWSLDGEYAGDKSEVQINNLHNAIKIIKP